MKPTCIVNDEKQLIKINVIIRLSSPEQFFESETKRKDPAHQSDEAKALEIIRGLEEKKTESTYGGTGVRIMNRGDAWQISSSTNLLGRTLEIQSEFSVHKRTRDGELEFSPAPLHDSDITDSLRYLMEKGIIKEKDAFKIVMKIKAAARPDIPSPPEFLYSKAANTSFSTFKEEKAEKKSEISPGKPAGM